MWHKVDTKKQEFNRIYVSTPHGSFRMNYKVHSSGCQYFNVTFRHVFYNCLSYLLESTVLNDKIKLNRRVYTRN